MSDHPQRLADGSPYMPTPEQYLDSNNENGLKKPRSSKPGQRHRLKRVILAIVALLAVAVAVYAAVIVRNVAKISTKPFSLAGLSADSTGRTNILVLGEGDPGHAGENLTDTIMVISIDKKTHQAAQISIPRDLRAKIPGHGTGKINSANAVGGVTAAEQTVSNTLGISINYYVLTNFSGLRGIVDAVGGLDINVQSALVDPEYPCADDQYKVCGLNIQPGLQHMDGATVLEYTRCRKGTCGNDFGRAARQQEVLGLLRQKVVRWSTVLNPGRLEPVTAALRGTITTDTSGVQLAEVGYVWQKAQTNHPVSLVLSTANGYLVSAGGSSDLVPADGTFAAIQKRVQNIFTTPVQPNDVPTP